MSFFKKKRRIGTTFSPPHRARRGLGKIFVVLKKIFILSLIVGVFFYATYMIAFTDFFDVNNIRYDLPESDIEEAELSPHLSAILGTNLIRLAPQEYEKKLQDIFPQLSSVKIKKIFPRQIEVSIETWPVSANILNRYGGFEKKFLINQAGFLISRDLENPNFPYIIMNSEKEFELKSRIMEKNRLEKILSAISLYEDFFDMKVFDALYLPIEREVHLRTEKNFYLWIDLHLDVEKQLKKLKKALPKLNIYQEALEYIDLRITTPNGERIDFKRKS